MDKNTLLGIFNTTARATDLTSPLFTNDCYRGGHFVISISSAQGSTASVVFTVQGLVGGTTGTFYTVLATTPLTAEGTVRLMVYPGLSTDANLRANDFLPAKWRLNADHTGAGTLKYSVGASLSL